MVTSDYDRATIYDNLLKLALISPHAHLVSIVHIGMGTFFHKLFARARAFAVLRFIPYLEWFAVKNKKKDQR